MGKPDQLLAVNVTQLWPEIAKGRATEKRVVLGEWSPWVGTSEHHTHFDPDRIAAILACRKGRRMAIYEVEADEHGDRYHWTDDERPRIVFHGSPSQHYAPWLHLPAPTWRRGQGTPLQVLDLSELTAGVRKQTIGPAVITVDDSAKTLTVSAPADYSVTLTRTA